MKSATGKPRGRPIIPAPPGERAPLGLKVSWSTKNLIDKLARESGCTQAKMVELLIERCFAYDRTLAAVRVTACTLRNPPTLEI
jgi:hypothetical protein